MIEVRATGWIGFGVANQAPNNMIGYDVGVGGVLTGVGYLKVKVSLIVVVHPSYFSFICRGYDITFYQILHRWLTCDFFL